MGAPLAGAPFLQNTPLGLGRYFSSTVMLKM